MTGFENYQSLLNKWNLKSSDIAKATGIANATLTDWKKGRSTPKQDKLKLIADYFGINVEYLMYGGDMETDDIRTQMELDIIADVDKIIKKLEHGDSVIMKYNDTTLTDDDKQLLRESLLSVCRQAKIMSNKGDKPGG